MLLKVGLLWTAVLDLSLSLETSRSKMMVLLLHSLSSEKDISGYVELR